MLYFLAHIYVHVVRLCSLFENFRFPPVNIYEKLFYHRYHTFPGICPNIGDLDA